MINKRRALFLDRDGVISIDHGYVHCLDKLEFIDSIFNLCRKVIDLCYLLIIVTNQRASGAAIIRKNSCMNSPTGCAKNSWLQPK